MNETILATLIGGAIAAIPTVILSIINARRDRERFLIETATHAAIANWQEDRKLGHEAAKARQDVTFTPLESYWLPTVFLVHRLGRAAGSQERIKKALVEARRLHKALVEQPADQTPKS